MRHIVRAAGPWEYYVRKVRIGLPHDCWEWQGSIGLNGYGNWSDSQFGGERVRTAHRASYELFFGSVSTLQVNHRCGNRRCCNPDHLYAGTQKQNSADAVKHGTFSPPPRLRGNKNGFAKLTEEQVINIKIRLRQGESQKALAEEHNVSPSAINLISKGRNWGWLA